MTDLTDKADCVFCKIIAKEIPSEKVYEDTDIYAFADIHPNNLGHTLIVPKKHFTNIYETPESELGKLIAAAKRVSIGVKKALKAEGVNIAMNNDKAAGQIIFHTHIHVIPRFSDDGYLHWKGPEMDSGEIRKAAEKIRGALS